MNVILFGATGMVGQGVLRECLASSQVSGVLAIGRTITGQKSPKLREIAQSDLFNLMPI
jgi:saccharopine dehydrogenase-like NADP-dependent oxidoreductase